MAASGQDRRDCLAGHSPDWRGRFREPIVYLVCIVSSCLHDPRHRMPELSYPPTALPDVSGSPFTVVEIAEALVRVHGESVGYWSGFSTEAFFAPLGRGWSPADQVRHLNKSILAVVLGMRLSRWVLRLLFGRPDAPSRSFEVMRECYQAVLRAGGQAGRYAPAPLDPSQATEATRQQLMRRHEGILAVLLRTVHRWPEADLDRYRLPHPLLGKLTVREMLFFTLYHNLHHVHVAERRRREG